MKRTCVLMIFILCFFLSGKRAEAKTTEYTAKKHKALLSEIEKFSSMHYSEYKRSFFPNMPKTDTYDSYFLNGDQKLLKIASKMRLREQKFPAERYLFDYRKGKVIELEGGNLPPSIRMKEEFLRERFPSGDDNLKEAFLRILDEYGVKPGRKGRVKGRREIYTFRLNGLRGMPKEMFRSCRVTYTIKRTKKGYRPESIAVDLRADMVIKNVLTKSFIRFRSFGNRKIPMPAN